MKLIHVENQVEGGKKAFELIREGMEERDVKVLGLATGSTPITMYEAMVNSDVDFSDMIGVNLDEYVGLDGEDEQSYRYFMNEHLYNAKPFKETYVPNGVAEDADAECARYNQILADNQSTSKS